MYVCGQCGNIIHPAVIMATTAPNFARTIHISFVKCIFQVCVPQFDVFAIQNRLSRGCSNKKPKPKPKVWSRSCLLSLKHEPMEEMFPALCRTCGMPLRWTHACLNKFHFDYAERVPLCYANFGNIYPDSLACAGIRQWRPNHIKGKHLFTGRHSGVLHRRLVYQHLRPPSKGTSNTL